MKKTGLPLVYRSMEHCVVQVSSAFERAQKRVWAWIKSATVGGDVRAMSFEAFLMSPPTGVRTGLINADVAKSLNDCRAGVERVMAGLSAEDDIEGVQKAIVKSKSVWISDDPHFDIELAALVGIRGFPSYIMPPNK